MISETKNTFICVGSLSDLAADIDGVANAPITYTKPRKLSEELRRERIKLFGKTERHGLVKGNKQQTTEGARVLPVMFNDIVEPWEYVARLADIIERKTNYTIIELFNHMKPPVSNYGKTFVVILRYGFGIKRRLICEYVNISPLRCNYILDNYRDKAVYSPEFNNVFNECLEELARFIQ